uniref:Adhesion G protein-coupled receptor G3 n=1 Tax=Amphilophus citrinellus TaxID=61819 RepID=A0A3Q0RJ53_AMPCI
SVRAGNVTLKDLPQPIKLNFSHDKEVKRHEKGYWSIEGCETTKTAEEFICSCNHLSFFAVLVVRPLPTATLSYITYAGSGLSALFTFIINIRLRWRPEKAVGLHMQLTGAMLCLHVAFLLSSLLVQRLKEDSSFCLVLGLFLHWSLLATLTWTALEGFHLYLLLVRVFNIYVRRYLLKLSLVGWGVPTLVAAICGISGVYGKYTLKNANNTTTLLLTSYITTVAFPFLVVVFNGCMLGLVVFKMWKIRKGDRDFGSNSDWKRINKEKRKRLWKDSVTVLGLSCVLGLPWGLASTTYISLAGIYVFTIFNSLQVYKCIYFDVLFLLLCVSVVYKF